MMDLSILVLRIYCILFIALFYIFNKEPNDKRYMICSSSIYHTKQLQYFTLKKKLWTWFKIYYNIFAYSRVKKGNEIVLYEILNNWMILFHGN